MDKDELKRLEGQIHEELWRGRGITTARILRRHKAMTVESAIEAAERTLFLEWRRVVGPKGGRPSIVFFQRRPGEVLVEEELIPRLLERLRNLEK
tara:strand:- start:1224 stop:1508 length:285 start_codon:yes stop_codon:yes gene_type:complete